MLFQQDGASPQYSVNARKILNEQMPNQWIGRRGPPEGAVFESLNQLANRIKNELQAIPTAMFRQAFRDFPKRCQLCMDNECGHFEM